IASLFNKEYQFHNSQMPTGLTAADLDPFRLPGHENANELVFVNGYFSFALSGIRSASLVVLTLEDAVGGEHRELVLENLGHSRHLLNDGINALNTAFIKGGVFIHVRKGLEVEHPVYIYNITDARRSNIFSQPRSLVHVAENARVQIVETYVTLGVAESFTNQVMETVVEKDAMVEYYKIQNDTNQSSQVSTTHIRQKGKSHVHTVVISLGAGMIRNNLNLVMEADHCEAHLYGLYFPSGNGHVDNHTIVDNVKPHCFSNEFYKGILDENATGVFNGKIFVRQDAQKTNAYQSNKNILLSDTASVNTKPQLEIFADDVKCSHGCTIGRLDEVGLFYLRSRGISEKTAKALLLHAFAVDILEHIKPEALRTYVDEQISERLEYNIA
ncbi:MAG TPA: Fe-S cluster assembly protein SufD, partial [Chitinophagaceae bacterium]|nr:Fe-S cluster assembly protein SufD [Chitinophagaceae bacterium]